MLVAWLVSHVSHLVVVVKTRGRRQARQVPRTDCNLSNLILHRHFACSNLASQLQGSSEEKKVDLSGDYIPDPFSSPARHTQEGDAPAEEIWPDLHPSPLSKRL